MREIALHILDLLQNAVEAGAGRVTLTIDEDAALDRLTIVVADDGRGMDAETIRRALDPFYTTRTTRHVGLGLPLMRAAAERADGEMTVESQPGVGTEVTATFCLSHPDRQPLGDMAGVLLAYLLSESQADLKYVHRRNGHSFEFDTAEIREALDGTPLADPTVRRWLANALTEGEEDLEHENGQAEVT